MSTSVSMLSSTFTSLITNLMEIERQPLTRLTTRKDTVSIQKAVYTDLDGYLDNLQSSVKALKSTDPFFELTPGKKATLSNIFTTATGETTSGTVASLSTTSSAVPGTYTLTGVTLAKAQIVSSARQAYSDQALGLAGSFVIGGAASRSAAPLSGTGDTVTGFGAATIVAGQKELGSGPYTVETRKDPTDANKWQFRLVDEDGQAVSIQLADKSGFSTGWQSIPATTLGNPVTFDTGRGLTLTFGDDASKYTAGNLGSGGAQASYTAQGATITVDAADSLNDIASMINSAGYADGNGISATVVDNRLILTSKKTGVNHGIQATDAGTTGDQILNRLGVWNGSAFVNKQQDPRDAVFTLSGFEVHRSQNTGLTNVISGATLDLASDAEGKTATINVAADYTQSKTAIKDFVSKFNVLQSYLGAKTAVTKQSDNTYKRGALAGETVFSGLRTDLYRLIGGNTANAGSFKNLSEIGVTLGDNLQLSLSDSGKLDSALQTNYDSVKKLLDAAMSAVDTQLGRFTGSGNYLDQAIKSTESDYDDLTDQITAMNARLDAREEQLTDQYAQYQTQMIMYQYTQSTLSTITSLMSYSA